MPSVTYQLADMGTITRPAQAVQTENEITRNEYDDTDDVDVDGVLVNEIDTPVVNTQELDRVAEASGQANAAVNSQLERQMFPLSTVLALQIIGS